MRHEFTTATKREAAKRADGHCEACGIKLLSGSFHFDHINPDWFSGDNDLSNCQVLCIQCHRAKRDITAIAKAKRIRDKERGIKSRKGPPMPGSRASKWKKTFSRGWILRARESSHG